MFTMSLGWEIYERTGSTLAPGFGGLTQVIAMILGTLPAGPFADLYNRKRIIVGMPNILVGTSLARTFLWATSA